MTLIRRFFALAVIILLSGFARPAGAATAVTGVCGSDNGTYLTTEPVPNGAGIVCAAGGFPKITANANDTWTWQCPGINGGAPSPTCTAYQVACGTASNGQDFSTAPAAGLCTYGMASKPSGSGSGSGNAWNWTCTDINNNSVSCSAPRSVNGVCGTDNGLPLTAAEAPVPNGAGIVCAAGGFPKITANANDTWTWQCPGINGGAPSPTCTAYQVACGTASNGQDFSTAPAAGLCTYGMASKPSGSGSGSGNAWNWTCTDINNNSVSCSAPRSVNGVCGTDNGLPLTAAEAPVPNGAGIVCAAGGFPKITANANDTWTWQCPGINGGAPSPTCTAYQVAAADVMSVSGTQLLDNGQPFVMKGVIFDFTYFPLPLLQDCYNEGDNCATDSSNKTYVNGHIDGYDYYFGLDDSTQGVDFSQGNDAFSVLKSWDVNTIRLNLDQAALDPTNANYSAAYVTEVTDAGARAEAQGYIVDLALFDGRISNAPQALLATNPQIPIDNATTESAALTLVQLFGKDRNVIIELLNEPYAPDPKGLTAAQNWQLWLKGGTVPNDGTTFAGQTFVGVNAEIAAMRAAGSQNVIGLQGLGASMNGFPGGIADPNNDILYAVHPFFSTITPTAPGWDAAFGTFAQTHPFAITAWNAFDTPATSPTWCLTGEAPIDTPYRFLQYLQQHNIGVVGYAFDVYNTSLRNMGPIVTGLNGIPTAWPPYCAVLGSGAGQILQQDFVNNDAPLAPAPSCTLKASPASISAGVSATLTWTTANAAALAISPTVGVISPAALAAGTGTISVSPTATTTFTGTVMNINNPGVTCSATVTVK